MPGGLHAVKVANRPRNVSKRVRCSASGFRAEVVGLGTHWAGCLMCDVMLWGTQGKSWRWQPWLAGYDSLLDINVPLAVGEPDYTLFVLAWCFACWGVPSCHDERGAPQARVGEQQGLCPTALGTESTIYKCCCNTTLPWATPSTPCRSRAEPSPLTRTSSTANPSGPPVGASLPALARSPYPAGPCIHRGATAPPSLGIGRACACPRRRCRCQARGWQIAASRQATATAVEARRTSTHAASP